MVVIYIGAIPALVGGGEIFSVLGGRSANIFHWYAYEFSVVAEKWENSYKQVYFQLFLWYDSAIRQPWATPISTVSQQ